MISERAGRKDTEAFVSRSIKSPSGPDAHELRAILVQVADSELQAYWQQFVDAKAHDEAGSVPLWCIKERRFLRMITRARLNYVSVFVDHAASGFRAHIKTHLIEHIEKCRQRNAAVKNLPTLKRSFAYQGMIAVIVLLAVLLLLELLSLSRISKRGVLVISEIWGALLMIGFLLFVCRDIWQVLSARRSGKDPGRV